MGNVFNAGLVMLLMLAMPVWGDWVDWRGPTADGRSTATELPLHWSEDKNIRWKIPIHDLGHSTPVIFGDQIWLTTANKEGTRLYAMAVDKDSGEILHDVEVFQVESPQRIHPLNSYATPSPTIEAGRVYVHYGALGTACLDTATGKVLWKRDDLPCEHMQGPASSPVLYGDLLIVHLEGTSEPYIVGLDKKTGETVWRYERDKAYYTDEVPGVYQKSYQTPVILEIEGKPQLISNGALMVTGHVPETGEELWRIRYKDDSSISRIVAGQGLLFVNTGGPPGGSELWGMRPGAKGDATDTHVVWKMTEVPPHESSPVLVDDLLYCMNDKGHLTCLEAKTGETVYTERLQGNFGASLLAVEGRIYLSNKKGKTTVIQPGRTYKVLAENQLDGELWASPAVTGDALILRTKNHLYRIEVNK